MLVEIKKMNKEEVTVVTSLDVAETFEKNHRDVMESIRNIGEFLWGDTGLFPCVEFLRKIC